MFVVDGYALVIFISACAVAVVCMVLEGRHCIAKTKTPSHVVEYEVQLYNLF